MTSFRGPRVKVHGVKMSRLISIAWLWRPRARLPPHGFFAARKDPRIRQAARSNDTRLQAFRLRVKSAFL
jgi:hypothetical protein